MNIFDFKTFINEVKKVNISGNLVMKDRMKMKKLLRENILIFKFQKRDGTIRRAVGTLYPKLLPPIKGTGGPKPVYQMVYYDLEKLEWRSFRSFKFIKIIKATPITDFLFNKYKKEIEEAEKNKKKNSTQSGGNVDIKKKTFKAGEKIPEDELERRSVDTRVGSRKNETTRKANDKFRKEHEGHEEHKHEDHHEDHHEEHKHEEHHEEKHEDHNEEHHDDEKKSFEKGNKIPEKELMRRSVDLRKGSRKNKFTKKANDSFKKGELED